MSTSPPLPGAPPTAGGPCQSQGHSVGSFRDRAGAISNRPVSWTGLFHLFVVYLVWGSTYLGIRVAVREGSGFPPFLLGASRTLTAAALLFAWNLLRRQRIRPCRNEWMTLLPAGLLLWVGGNGLVNWAEQRADSGYAALLVGAMPIWVVLMESLVDRRRPTLHLIGALIVCGPSGVGHRSTYVPQLRPSHGYPNPANDWVRWEIQQTAADRERVDVKVMSVDGRCVRSWSSRVVPRGTVEIL